MLAQSIAGGLDVDDHGVVPCRHLWILTDNNPGFPIPAAGGGVARGLFLPKERPRAGAPYAPGAPVLVGV
jgi:hypothetical protein